RRSILHLPARAYRGLPGCAEATGAVPRGHGAVVGWLGRIRALSVRPPRGAPLYAARPGFGLSPGAWLWLRTRADGLAGQYSLPQSVHPLHQPGYALLERQAHFGRDPGARLRSELRFDCDRAPRGVGPAQQP